MSRLLHRLSFITVVILVSGLQGLAEADVITLNTMFPGRGWFAETGLHNPLNDNTYTGISCCPNGINLNSFFVWDVRALAGKQVTSAVLRLGQDSQTHAGLEIVEIHNVLSSRSALIAGYDTGSLAGTSIYDDLQSGSLYGTFHTTGPGILDIRLNRLAIADLNGRLARGDADFAVGLHLTTGSGSLDGVKFDGLQEITVNLVPEPSTLWLVVTGIVGLAGRKRLRRQSR